MKTKKGKWTINDSKLVYKNPWIQVREDQVITPANNKGIFGVVTMKPGVSVLPMDENGNVYLTQEYHYAVERVTIEVVSGGIDDGESSLEAAKRELKEETGLIADEWVDLASVDPFTTVIYSPVQLYLARNLKHGQPDQESTEDIEVIKVPFDTALEWAMNGKITHSPSVVVLLKTAHWLKKVA